MYGVANALLKYNSEYVVDYKKKYGISINSESLELSNENTFKENEIINVVEKQAEIENKDIIEEINSIEKNQLYKELKLYRLNKSREEKTKPYFIYNNLQLEAIIKAKPKTIEELNEVNGFGKVKCEKYGEAIIEMVKKY